MVEELAALFESQQMDELDYDLDDFPLDFGVVDIWNLIQRSFYFLFPPGDPLSSRLPQESP